MQIGEYMKFLWHLKAWILESIRGALLLINKSTKWSYITDFMFLLVNKFIILKYHLWMIMNQSTFFLASKSLLPENLVPNQLVSRWLYQNVSTKMVVLNCPILKKILQIFLFDKSIIRCFQLDLFLIHSTSKSVSWIWTLCVKLKIKMLLSVQGLWASDLAHKTPPHSKF